jgi:hypothetical protein
MTTNDNDYFSKISNHFYCILCDYKCSRKYNFKLHNDSKRHKNNENDNKNNGNLVKISKTYTCENCDKDFNDRAGLWRHKKKCLEKGTFIDGININDKDALVLHLLKQNTELQHKIIDIASKPNSINSNNNIKTNNSFNLNFFLNETCKDAMNISEFVSSIKVSLDDLENTGRRGYIEGISNIILKNLNNLEQQLRPVHCSDSKREVFYIKDNNEWKKENDEKPILTKAIKVIANENIKQIKNWKEKYPDCTYADSKKNNLYLKIVSNSMNGLTEEEGYKNINKIISNVAKEVIIDKT